MVVLVEEGLDTVKAYLQEQGFSVVTPDSTQNFDAVVYQNTGILSIPEPTRPAFKSSVKTQGTLLVCAAGRTPEEIATMLRQKAYSNLF